MLRTTSTDLVLLELRPSHARELYELLQNNRDHLTALGDYKEQVSASLTEVEAELADESRKGLRFGIFLASDLIGRMDLVPVDPPRYGLGYWLDRHKTGKGYATSALRALVGHAKNVLKASDLYAGVTHGNKRSADLLSRAGFSPVADFEKYIRYHLPLISDALPRKS